MMSILSTSILLWAMWQPGHTCPNDLHPQPSATVNGRLSNVVYYVSSTGNDSDDGSCNRPWATIQHADSIVRPGNTVIVLDGTYKGDISLASSGTPGHPITYRAENKWKAKLMGTSSGNGSAVIGLSGGYTIIQDFDITGTNANGIILASSGAIASYNQAIGNYVHDMVVPCNSNSGTAIETGGGDNYSGITNNDMIGNLVVNITPENGCVGGHQASGLFAEIPDSVIANNIVINAGYGIQSWHAASHVTIYGNTLMDNLRSITIGAGDAPYGRTNDYSLVQNNIIYNSTDMAIAETGRTGRHNRYIDNLIYGGKTTISLNNGLQAKGTITANPLFVNSTSAATDNYQLKANSPVRWSQGAKGDETTAVGELLVRPRDTRSMKATGAGGVPAAGISADATSVVRGHSSVVTWTTKNAVSATLNGLRVPLNGSRTVRPEVTTTYKVVATGPTGRTDWGAVTVVVH
jgi:hypothetical protein